MATITKYNIPRSSNSGENNGSNSVTSLGGGLGFNEIKENFLPASPTDEEQTKYDVAVEGTFKKNVTLPSITLQNADGTKTATISLDSNGNILINKSLVSEEDLVAYGVGNQDIATLEQMIRSIIEQEGGGGGIASIELSLNQSDYKLQAIVTNLDGDTITSNVIDFPIESVVVGGEYDATNKNIILTLKNGGQVTFSVADLVSGLASTGYVDSAVAGITKESLGLGNVDNTADANKNVASAVCLVDNGNSSNKVYIAYSGTGYTAETASHLCATGLQDGKRVYRDISASEAKKFIGLGNVNNTSDADKPISTATQTALNGKLSLSGGTMTGGFVFRKTESNNSFIYDVENGNSVITSPLYKSTAINSACAIRSALAFRWYGDIYQIGAIRGASTNCDGFGVTKGNNDLLFQITPGGAGYFKSSVISGGDVTAYSDRRLKSDIKDLEFRGPLEPKTYIKDGKKCIGFIAQEVREKYPELVLGEEKQDEYLSLNYGAITAVLAAENKELRNEVTELKNEVEELKKLLMKGGKA